MVAFCWDGLKWLSCCQGNIDDLLMVICGDEKQLAAGNCFASRWVRPQMKHG
jgi:hypothetical protein